MKIKVDPLTSPEIKAFLEEHIEDMKSTSPPESKHAIDIDGLKAPDITFWSAYEDRQLIGCGALKELNHQCGEIKSMRVSTAIRAKGIGSKILNHIIAVAQSRGYHSLKLETGSMEYFSPARNLYIKNGFRYCDPFAEYTLDPNSVFMELKLRDL
ncbi:GNAT family N-acetyltransferase [Gynuella sp.]|uniref:GNAT family N-acetyltransferase n=1 Tax=Gynuella sp. TaxID=2969146 RepID=UPI003D098EF6